MNNLTIDFNLIKKYGLEIFTHNKLIPIFENDIFIELASFCPNEKITNKDYLENRFSKPIKIVVYEKNDIEYNLKEIGFKSNLLELSQKVITDASHSSNDNENNNAVLFLKELLSYAINSDSSDIHMEVQNNKAIFRFRVDGKLREVFSFKVEIFITMSALIKLISKLDVAQKRVSQDGRFTLTIGVKQYDFRVSIIPTINLKESIVIRILDKDKKYLSLKNIGLNTNQFNIINRNINKAQGMILVTGATGSGKTTTMYSLLNQLDKKVKKIITIEDPVEYQIDGIIQINIDESRGMTFASILKNILRQDPDVILIGEIRDKESLSMALQAALTGHLVIATLHTNDTLKTIDRLYDLGAEPFLISSVLKLIISQRLIRNLCERCKKKYEFKNKIFAKPIGCEKCNYTGYKGRELVIELLDINDEFESKIREQKINEIIIKKKYTLNYQIFQKLLNFTTSLEEYYFNEI